jgi:hypothetical protein
VGRLLFLEVQISLYSFLLGRLLLQGVLPLFNGLPLNSGIFFSSKKGCLGGKYLPQLPKHQHVVHKQGSNARVLHEMCPTLLLQDSKDSNIHPMPCAPLGPLPLHEHCGNLDIPKSTPCLNASIQATPCCLGLNTLLQNDKCSSSNARLSPSRQPPPFGQHVECRQVV